MSPAMAKFQSTLGLAVFLELQLEEVAPRFERNKVGRKGDIPSGYPFKYHEEVTWYVIVPFDPT